MIAVNVPHSSVVGSSIMINDADTGENVALLIISVPNTRRPYKETTSAVIDWLLEHLPRS